MKKCLKFFLISVGSLFLIISISASILIWVVFTPEKITPIIQKQLTGMVTCEAGVEDVSLTFFSTFPRFGIKTGHIYFKNPTPGAPSDTLFSSRSLSAIIDFDAFRKHRKIVFNELSFDNASLLLFFGTNGITNFNIMVPKDEPDTTAFNFPFALLDIRLFKLQNASIIYADTRMDMIVELNEVSVNSNFNLRGDLLKANLNLNSEYFSVKMDSVQYVLNEQLSFNSPISFGINNQLLTIENGKMYLKHLPINLNLKIQNKPDEILTDIDFKSTLLDVPPVLELLKPAFGEYFDGMNMTGNITLDASIKGVMSQTEQPHFKLGLIFKDNTFDYHLLPYRLSGMSGNVLVDIDLNDSDKWHILINNFRASTGKSVVNATGRIDQLMGDMRFNLNTYLNFNLTDAKPFLPKDMPLSIDGRAKGRASLNFLYSEFMKNQFDKMRINGNFRIHNLYAVYDTISISSPSAEAFFQWPMHRTKPGVWADLQLKSPNLNLLMGRFLKANIFHLSFDVESNNIMITGAKPKFDCSFSFQYLNAVMDTMHIAMNQTNGCFSYVHENELLAGPQMKIDARSADLNFKTGTQQFSAADIQLNSLLNYDASIENPMLRWFPFGEVHLIDGLAKVSNIPDEIQIPKISFEFDADEFLIHESSLNIGQSDLSISGKISDFRPYFKKEGMLKAELNFRSGTTDLNYLLPLISGFGDENNSIDVVNQASKPSSGPFMVPKGVDITLNARIDEALFAKDVLRDVEGKVIVRDGLLVLESVLFTASAAKMQLTGMYETPRRNHIFMGLDFHLMDIEIAELLAMIPDVDTIMPMLRSFDGRGEFHLAIETYVDSAYNIKFSTLRGVSSVKGTDLVLLDGETFSEIARTLRFTNQARNKVDSLSAEFTIFRNQVDIFPFLIVMDRYKAIVSGQHNLDMSFDYHISLVESPLPIQIGVDVRGRIGDMRVRLAAPKYPNMFRPARRNELERKQIEIREMIRNSLLEKVRQ